MYMLLSIDWLFIVHCIVCFPAFLLQFSRSPGMKRAHGQAEHSSLQKLWRAYKTAECRSGLVKLKRVSGDQKAWSWWEFNALFALTWGRGEKDPGLHAGRAVLVSRARSDTKIQTVSHVWTAYEWTKRSQDDSVYCMLWQSSPVPALICFSNVEVYRAGPDLRSSVIQVCWRWSWGMNSALGWSAVWPCDWSTPLPVEAPPLGHTLPEQLVKPAKVTHLLASMRGDTH